MEEILQLIGISSHYLAGSYTSQVVQDVWTINSMVESAKKTSPTKHFTLPETNIAPENRPLEK